MSKLWWMGGAVALTGAVVGFVLLPSISAPVVAPATAAAPTPPVLNQPVVAPAVAMPSPAKVPVSQGLQPAPVAAATPAAEVSLWRDDQLSEGTEDGVAVHYATLQPEALHDLNVGQTLELALPGRSQPLRARLGETRNGDGVAIWQGSLIDGDPAETLTVVRGAIETHLTVATLQGSYSVIVDNQTGKAVITDENDLAARANPHGDTVNFQDGEQPRPPIPG
ncbi:MAG: hypothetical protein ABWY06_14125 [Pseudomonas sp.]|uniref:hypothetical protein n=1 Tax=Pseudomonas sp. TaxID=306 RepID=UPI0033920F19